MFSCEFREIFKKNLFRKQLWTTVSIEFPYNFAMVQYILIVGPKFGQSLKFKAV